MEYIHWIGGSFWLFLLILCIPLIAYALKYGRAVDDCAKMEGTVLNPYLTNAFRWWFKGAVDEEANKYWDKALKGTKFKYQAFGLFHGKEVHEFQKVAHEYRIKHWRKYCYPILNHNIGHALFNIFMFGFFAFPMGTAVIVTLLHKPLQSIGTICSPATLAFVLLMPLVIIRCRKLKIATKNIIESGEQPQTGDNVGGYDDAWERRGSIMYKILNKYFDNNEEHMVAYANQSHIEDHCIAYTKICKSRNCEWIYEPGNEYVTYNDGGYDRGMLMSILLIGTIAFVAIIGLLQISFLADIVGMVFKAIGGLISLPTRI